MIKTSNLISFRIIISAICSYSCFTLISIYDDPYAAFRFVIGLPPVIHFRWGFSGINHPAIGVDFRKPPKETMCIKPPLSETATPSRVIQQFRSFMDQLWCQTFGCFPKWRCFIPTFGRQVIVDAIGELLTDALQLSDEKDADWGCFFGMRRWVKGQRLMGDVWLAVPSGKLRVCYGISWSLQGKSTINGPFSIALLVYQRVLGLMSTPDS